MSKRKPAVAALVLSLLVAGVVAGRFALDAFRAPEAPRFDDVTAAAGLSSYTGMTYGAAWGDFDGDGLPDLYVTNHLNPAKLFRNEGKGRFSDVTAKWLADADTGGDKHGAAWADFDNDGRLDLVQLMGAERGVGSEKKRLLVNRGTRFEDIGEAAGMDNPLSRTRMPLWVDLDRDGRLDLFQGAEARPDRRELPFLFLQRNGRFQPASELAAFASRSAPFCVLTALTRTAAGELVCRAPQPGRTAQIFSIGQLPLKELDLLPVTAFEDIAAADFDNDGEIDLYLARKNPPGPVGFGRPSPNEVIADVLIDRKNAENPIGFRFRSSGALRWTVAPLSPGNPISSANIYIGERSAHPGAMEFTVQEGTRGSPALKPGSAGVYIGSSASDEWQVLVSAALGSPGAEATQYQQVAIRVRSSGPLTELGTLGDKDSAEEAPARLLMNRGGKLVEESDKRGVNARRVSAVNAVAADFNNDMHIDLFVVVSGEVGKQENLLLLNRGDGRFVVVPGAGGASGDSMGVGDSVTTVDFDRDGFMDLLVTTGGSMGRSLGMASDSGGYRLYRNRGNANHWLEIDLEGTKSNRDGIGARVEVLAGGVSQVRIQDGGVHHRGQNHSRLHFGLARHAQAERLTVRWPSGVVQELTAVPANQVLRIREP